MASDLPFQIQVNSTSPHGFSSWAARLESLWRQSPFTRRGPRTWSAHCPSCRKTSTTCHNLVRPEDSASAIYTPWQCLSLTDIKLWYDDSSSWQRCSWWITSMRFTCGRAGGLRTASAPVQLVSAGTQTGSVLWRLCCSTAKVTAALTYYSLQTMVLSFLSSLPTAEVSGWKAWDSQILLCSPKKSVFPLLNPSGKYHPQSSE